MMKLLALGIAAAAFSVAVMRAKPRTSTELLHPRCNSYLPIRPKEIGTEAVLSSPPSKLDRAWRPGDNTVLGNKEFDLVLFGATGFTGSLVAKYLASRYDPGVKWAIAGRSKTKLDALFKEFDPVLNHGVGVVVADASDEASLQALVARARVVVTTAGPYTDYGTLLVKACAGSGVHYADLSGEPFWQREMVDAFDHVARSTGAKVVLASGYDSVPFDLGALHALEEYHKAYGSSPAVSEITAVVTESRGWASGGTVASAIKTAKLIWAGGVSQAAVADPYLLVPQDDPGVVGACRSDLDVSGWGSAFPRYDSDVQALGIPHFMAVINARVVRRSLALKGLRNVSYAEGVSVGALVDWFLWIGKRVLTGEFPLGDFLPKPGDGPSPVVMRDGSARAEFVAKSPPSSTSTSRFVRTEVTFVGDPGYNATSRMLAEAGLCLATPSCHLSNPNHTPPSNPLAQKDGDDDSSSGGVLTPASAMGMGLVRRLQAADNGKFMQFRLLASGELK